MWQQLLNLDLVDRIEFSQGNSQVLRAALTDTRALRVTADTDMVWVRLLDVTRALEARTYSGDGALELHIDDPLEHINGIYRLTVTDGVARVKPLRNLTGAPAVHIDATQLASAVFRGSESAGQLGLISGSGVAEFDTLFAVSDEPWSDFSF